MTLETGWRDDAPVADSILRAFLHNQADVGDLVAAAVGGRHARVPGLALADNGGPVVYPNQAILFRPVLTADDPLLAEVDGFFAGSPAAMLLSAWPTPDLSVRGWQLIGHPMFVVRAPGPHEAGPPDGPSIVPAQTADQLALAERVVIDGYPLPEAAGLPRHGLFGVDLLGGPIRIRVAFVDGEPAGVASGHVGHGVENLCLAATRPAARRRGAWKSLVWARVDDAPELPAVAFTSDDSRPGFIRLGFLSITRFTLWLVPGVG
ncbi:MAG TPA: hypothetical protein VIC62_01740 [Nakamurella sp.]|jgi:hypothetical protein